MRLAAAADRSRVNGCYLGPLFTCPVSCFGGVDIYTHALTLYGDEGNDVVATGNSTGIVRFYGGTDDDWLQHTGDADDNVYWGGFGNDTIIDGGGNGNSGDSLVGDIGEDCLEDYDFRVLHCGPGLDEWATNHCCVDESCEPEGAVSSCD